MSFFENTRKPQGFGGKFMTAIMNSGHGAMAQWGLTHIQIAQNSCVPDMGCGGDRRSYPSCRGRKEV